MYMMQERKSNEIAFHCVWPEATRYDRNGKEQSRYGKKCDPTKDEKKECQGDFGEPGTPPSADSS
jgi:hypothetical protein